MDNSKNRKLGAMLSYVSIIANTLIQLIYAPFMIQCLGQSEYGLYSLINSVIGYLTLLDLGFGNAIVVYTSKYRAQGKIEEEKKLHGMFFIIFCFISFIAGICGIILYFNVENLFSSTMSVVELGKAKIMMLILTFNLVITFVFSIYSSILNAYEKFVYQKLISILNSILKPIIMIPLLFLGYKSITMVVVITVLNCCVLLSNYLYCRKKLNVKIKYSGFDKILFKTILGYSIWIFLTTVVDKVNYSVDNFILGMISGTIAVSIYSIANTLSQVFINLSTAMSGVFLPKITKLIANGATKLELSNEWIKVGRLQYYIIFLAASGFTIFGKRFIYMWVGKEFENSYYIALLLILPGCVPLIQNVGLSIMQAMNKYKFKAISTFIMAIFNIIISIILAKKWGEIGAAMGTTIALCLCNIVLINIYYWKNIKLDVMKFWKEIIKMTIPFLIPIITILIIIKIFPISNTIIYLGYIVIYMILFTIISLSFVINDYEKSLIDSILMKLKIKGVKNGK